MVLRRAVFISGNRMFDMDRMAHAAVTGPRVVAVVVVTVLLYPLAAVAILAVGFGFARVLGAQNLAVSLWSVHSYLGAVVVLEGLLRLALFGLIIGLCTTHAGLVLWQGGAKGGSANAVGDAVYRGSVLSLVGVVTVNLALSLLGGTG